MWGINPFLLRVKCQVCELLTDCRSLCWGWGGWQDHISTPPVHLKVALSSSADVKERFSWFSGSCSESIVPCVALDSVGLWEEVNSVSSYVPLLDHTIYTWLFLPKRNQIIGLVLKLIWNIIKLIKQLQKNISLYFGEIGKLHYVRR